MATPFHRIPTKAWIMHLVYILWLVAWYLFVKHVNDTTESGLGLFGVNTIYNLLHTLVTTVYVIVFIRTPLKSNERWPYWGVGTGIILLSWIVSFWFIPWGLFILFGLLMGW